MAQTPHHFEARITQTVRLDYLLYHPPDYDRDPVRRWPMLLYLHGSSGRGSDVNQVKQGGIPHNLENGHDLPFVVVSPQCPANSHWTLHIKALNALLDEVIARNRIDEDRVCMTGVSLGGAGAWMLAGAYPERFAAVAPVAARIVPLPLERLKDVAIWALHGEADNVVPVSEAQRTVDALHAIGARVKLTLVPGAGHDVGAQIYGGSELYEWLLEQKRT